jgi:hypothetical protein
MNLVSASTSRSRKNKKLFLLPCVTLAVGVLPSAHSLSPPSARTTTTKSTAPSASRRLKNQGRHRRIEVLLQKSATANSLTPNESRELENLQMLGDPYDASIFPEAHTCFKQQHNQAFCDLLSSTQSSSSSASLGPVIYLDGADGATTRVLLDAGIQADRLHVVNEWPDTVATLQKQYPEMHLYSGKLQDMDCAKNLAFVGAYLDGCGGSTQPILDMVAAVLQGQNSTATGSITSSSNSTQMVLGFTLTNAETTGRPVLDRIQDVTRYIRGAAQSVGFDMMYHVGDDPERFGVDPNLMRQHETTTTSWVVLIRQ